MVAILKDVAAIITAPAFLVAVTALIHSVNTRKGKGSAQNGSKSAS
jgi:hypothetical protein